MSIDYSLSPYAETVHKVGSRAKSFTEKVVGGIEGR